MDQGSDAFEAKVKERRRSVEGVVATATTEGHIPNQLSLLSIVLDVVQNFYCIVDLFFYIEFTILQSRNTIVLLL